jgi:anthranilate synthase component II
MKVLVIDCYDSFTFNLCQQVGKLGGEPVVLKNDVPIEKVQETECERIILSPGPGRPEDSGVCIDVIRRLSPKIPTLGVCLGHQAICTVFGGTVARAGHLMHGKTSEIRHDGGALFRGLSNPFTATRYHSLVAEESTLPDELKVSARSLNDGYIMGVRHTEYPIFGIQFHPESILCREGDVLIRNFLSGDIMGIL